MGVSESTTKILDVFQFIKSLYQFNI